MTPQLEINNIGNSLNSELKNEVRFETYLELIKNVKTRVAVTKMRISCHLLPIESGRYKRIPRVERLCPLCNRSEIGDEFHYLLTFILLYFICCCIDCFGTEIFMSKIKSIKLLLLCVKHIFGDYSIQ